jgi:signal transduction histidine kinase
MTLRSNLLLLLLVTLLPVAILAAATGKVLVDQQRATFVRGAEERVRAVLTAIDTELEGSITSLQVLSAVPSVHDSNRARFRETAASVLETQSSWVNVNMARPDGQLVFNLLLPDDAPLPNIRGLDDSFERLVRTRRPVISDLAMGRVRKEVGFAARVPVMRNGEIAYVLSAGINPDSILRIVEAQRLPPEWVGAVLDRNGRIVARSMKPAESFGHFASDSLRAAMARAPTGWFHGPTIEGDTVYAPYARSELSGWTFAMGIPASAVEAPARQATLMLGIGMAVALFIAIALALLVGRRIAHPIASLAAATEAVGRGEPVGIKTHSRVQEIERLEQALRAAAEAIRERQALVQREQDALRAADRAKDEFIAMLSHELRNPLAALTSAAQVLETSGPGDEMAPKAAEIIARQTRHMTNLVGDLLDINALIMGKATLRRAPIDLVETVTSLVDTWKMTGRLADRAVTLDASPAWVDADRSRIEQVASNLLDNAVKFTPAGGKINVGVRRDGEAVVLMVADSGEGISAAAIEHVFDLFVQGDREREPARTRGGLGIGLALVKRIVELHGGTVSAASAGAGRGATFTVRLPAALTPRST